MNKITDGQKNMSTQRQKKLARLIVENASLDKPLNGGRMLEKVGYSKNLVKQPGRVLNADGVQEELEILGFTEANAKKVVQEIMLDEKADRPSRLKAADMVFKVQGTYAPEKRDLTTKGEKIEGGVDVQAIADKAAELLKVEKICPPQSNS